MEAEASEGVFPDWRQLVEPDRLGGTVSYSIDAKALIGLLQAVVGMTGHSQVTLLVPTEPGGRAMVVAAAEAVTVRGVIVPAA
jgi:hypothetical protein